MEGLASIRPQKGHYSIAEVRDHWYIACRSKTLKSKPLPITILGTPIVLFRSDTNKPSALLDRCAHRNVPLSLGYCQDAPRTPAPAVGSNGRGREDGLGSIRLVCGYHGWEYDGAGVCQKVPALCGPQTGKARRVPSFACVEQQGFVWIYANADTTPKVEPFSFPFKDEPKYTSVNYESEFEATLHATLENILDVPHTAFLHRGLFRGVKQNEITAIVRRKKDRVEAEYVGEPRPSGVMGAILAPGGGTIVHFDRFILPSVAQVEYALGAKNHVIVSSALTPVTDFLTKLYAVVTFKIALPNFILRLLLTPIGKRVAKQDAVMLREQTEMVKRFGGEQFVSTDVDIMGPHILRLLRQAERGELATDDGAAIAEEQVRLLA